MGRHCAAGTVTVGPTCFYRKAQCDNDAGGITAECGSNAVGELGAKIGTYIRMPLNTLTHRPENALHKPSCMEARTFPQHGVLRLKLKTTQRPDFRFSSICVTCRGVFSGPKSAVKMKGCHRGLKFENSHTALAFIDHRAAGSSKGAAR